MAGAAATKSGLIGEGLTYVRYATVAPNSPCAETTQGGGAQQVTAPKSDWNLPFVQI
jgi:hypothetical protein